jgi:hypothetical protein
MDIDPYPRSVTLFARGLCVMYVIVSLRFGIEIDQAMHNGMNGKPRRAPWTR